MTTASINIEHPSASNLKAALRFLDCLPPDMPNINPASRNSIEYMIQYEQVLPESFGINDLVATIGRIAFASGLSVSMHNEFQETTSGVAAAYVGRSFRACWFEIHGTQGFAPGKAEYGRSGEFIHPTVMSIFMLAQIGKCKGWWE